MRSPALSALTGTGHWHSGTETLHHVCVLQVRLVHPYLLTLNERFATTPFSTRVAEDRDGFYKDVASAFDDKTRPHNIVASTSIASENGGASRRPRFVFRV